MSAGFFGIGALSAVANVPAPGLLTGPAMFSVRASGDSDWLLPLAAPLTSGPYTVVVPVPDIAPPDQTNMPVTVKSPGPVMVPPDKVRLLVIVEAAAIASVPAEKIIGAELLRL